MLKRSLLVLLLAAFAASSVPISAAQSHDPTNKKTVYHPKAKAKAKRQATRNKPAPKVTKKVVKKKVVKKPETKKG